MGRHSKSSQNQTSNASVHRLLFFFVVNYANLAVLDEAHVKRALAEGLPLHVDAVFTDETVASFAAGHDALAGAPCRLGSNTVWDKNAPRRSDDSIAVRLLLRDLFVNFRIPE